MNQEKSGKIFFFLILGLFSVLTFYVLEPYISIAILALILVYLFSPLYDWFYKLFRRSAGLASLCSSSVVFLFFLLPIIFLLIISANQALEFFRSAETFLRTGDEGLKKLVAIINSIDDKLPFIDVDFKIQNIQDLINTYGREVGFYISNKILDVVTNLGLVLTNGFIFFLVLVYLFPEKDKITKRILKFSPLPDKVDMLFWGKLPQTAKSMFKGTVIVAVVQGVLGGFYFYLIGIPAPVFWALIMTFLSFIPVGSGVIWGPAGIFFLLSGKIWQGAFVLLWGALVINSMDNILRPRLVSKETHMHPVLTFLSILGGLRLFGFFGLLYGPLIMVLFLTALEIYQEYYSKP